MMIYLPGDDVSFWQADVAWEKMAEKSRFAFLRCGQNRAVDAWFKVNWPKSQGVLPRGPYWFFDWRSGKASPKEQGKIFYNAIRDLPGELPSVMDFEKPYASWTPEPFPARSTALDTMRYFRDEVKTDKILLYINPSTLKTLRPFPDWLTRDWMLYIAVYPLFERRPDFWDKYRTHEEVPQKRSPSIIEDTFGWEWTFWQFTDKLYGPHFGVSSLDMDGDFFSGSEADFAQLCGQEVPKPEPDITPDEVDALMWRTARSIKKILR